MSDGSDYESLYEGDPKDVELFQIWKATQTQEIHIMINGNFMFVLGNEGLSLLKEAVTVADQKNNPK